MRDTINRDLQEWRLTEPSNAPTETQDAEYESDNALVRFLLGVAVGVILAAILLH